MAFKMASGSSNVCTFDLADLKAKAAALNIDWGKLWADIQKYGPGLAMAALTLGGDLLAQNWVKAWTDFWALEPEEAVAVLAILKDLGISFPWLTPATP